MLTDVVQMFATLVQLCTDKENELWHNHTSCIQVHYVKTTEIFNAKHIYDNIPMICHMK